MFKGRRFQKLLYETLHPQTKLASLARRLILLAILLYEQFINYAHIDSHPNKQLFSTRQHAYQ